MDGSMRQILFTSWLQLSRLPSPGQENEYPPKVRWGSAAGK